MTITVSGSCILFSDSTVQATAALGIPTGTIVSFSANVATPPTGYICTGTIYNQNDYPTLYCTVGLVLNPMCNIVSAGAFACSTGNVAATSQTNCSPWGLYGWGCLTTSSVTDCNACSINGYITCCNFTMVTPLMTSSTRSPGCGASTCFSCTGIYTCIVQATCFYQPWVSNRHCCCCDLSTGCCFFTSINGDCSSGTNFTQYYGFKNNCTGGCGCWYLCCVMPCAHVGICNCYSCSSQSYSFCGNVYCMPASFASRNPFFSCNGPMDKPPLCKPQYLSSDCKCRALLATGFSYCTCSYAGPPLMATNGTFRIDYTTNGGVTWNYAAGIPCQASFPGTGQCVCILPYTCATGILCCLLPATPLHNYNPKSNNFFVIPTGLAGYGGGCCFCAVGVYAEQILTTNNFSSWTCSRISFATCCLYPAQPSLGTLNAYGITCYNDTGIFGNCLNNSNYASFETEVIFDQATNCNYWLTHSQNCGGPSSFFSFEPSTGCFIKYIMPCAYKFMTIFNGCALYLQCFTDTQNGCLSSPPEFKVCSTYPVASTAISYYPAPIYVVPLACAQNSYQIFCKTNEILCYLLVSESATVARSICGNFYGGFGGITTDGINYTGSMCAWSGNSCFCILGSNWYNNGPAVTWSGTCVIGIDWNTWTGPMYCGIPEQRYTAALTDCVQCATCFINTAIVNLAGYNTSTQFQTPCVVNTGTISGCCHFYIKT